MKFKATAYVLISSLVFLSFYISVPAYATLDIVHFSVGDEKQYVIFIFTDAPDVMVDECKKDANGDWQCNNIAHDRSIPTELKGALDKLTLSPENANPTNHKNSTSTKGLNEPGIRIGDGGLAIKK